MLGAPVCYRRLSGPAPGREHTDEILAELGLERGEIDALCAARVDA